MSFGYNPHRDTRVNVFNCEPVPIRTRADLAGTVGFQNLDVDDAGNPCVWRNHYRCDHKYGGAEPAEWIADHSCQRDDECPVCETAVTPTRSEWLGPGDEPDALWLAKPDAQ
jgi:hypothetical protein